MSFHEQQTAHFQQLEMQKRQDIERFIPLIAQEMKRPNIPIQPRKPAHPDVKCEECGKEANFMCSSCKGAHYCSTECQVTTDSRQEMETILICIFIEKEVGSTLQEMY